MCVYAEHAGRNHRQNRLCVAACGQANRGKAVDNNR